MSGGRDWHALHEAYADPTSSLSRRLAEVRSQLAALLADCEGPVRLLSLCSGDGRDTVPVLAASGREVDACLIELDPELAEAARLAAREADVTVEVRTADAGAVAAFEDLLPVDVVRTVAAARVMVATGGAVIWTRGKGVPGDPTAHADPAEWVRGRFEAVGFEAVVFVTPDDASYRVGVERQRTVVDQTLPERLFSFVP